jgi:AraC-like DNA-binding protein
MTHATSNSKIFRQYRAILPPEERVDGIWGEPGIAFIARKRSQVSLWQASRAEPRGSYHFYIQGREHVQCGEFNGVPCRAHCRAQVVQFVRPDETVHTAGVGETSILQVSIAPEHLTERLGYEFVRPRGLELRGRQRVDFSLRLAATLERGLAHGLSGDELYFDEIREAILNRILTCYATRAVDASAVREDLVPAKVRIVLDYIDANLGANLRLAQLCMVAGFSRAHFARAFRRAAGLPPHAYVTLRRLARAMELVAKRESSITDIAQTCGFADSAHLTRCFKLCFGFVPVSNAEITSGLD